MATPDLERAIKAAYEWDWPTAPQGCWDEASATTKIVWRNKLKAALATLDSPSDAVVETAARAICSVEEPEFDPGMDDEGREPPLWTSYREHACAAIRAYLAAIRGEK